MWAEVAKLGIMVIFQMVRNGNLTLDQVDELYAEEKAKFDLNDPGNLPDPE